MEWTDEAILLSARKHGESAAIVTLLTRAHGRHAGLVHGGGGGRGRALLQPGNEIEARWRARLADHLGVLTCEPLHSGAALLLDDPLRLAVLSSACALAEAALPEREPHADVYDGLKALIAALEATDRVEGWGRAYVAWELGVLSALGFGLDLTQCAATGSNDDLAYVSPRTGRAVSLSAGESYRDRLLPLPAFLASSSGAERPVIGAPDILAALALTAHFFERHVFSALHRPLPPARAALTDRLRRSVRPNEAMPPPAAIS